ncbi:MAG: histidine triad nucleotide-binding protein [Nitrospinae bacterium RIFCSPLOWO2_12_FULL_47_7]|nr:MAG: histidine triad nucleotide-binding protein [Nitrospinae bacterium RIFCSPLOWO2_12_FULL_47_7]
MKNCLFCKIIEGKIPAKKVFEDDRVCVIEDINPQAPIHFLILPKKHLATLLEIEDCDHELLGHAFSVGNQIAKEKKLAGFRVVVNCGESAGQSVFHIHFHLLGGRAMNWPPG